MDPNQNNDQAGQVPGMPQDDNTVPQPSPAPGPTAVPEPTPAPEPSPAPEPEPSPAAEVPTGTMEEVPPPPPVVEEHPEAGQSDVPQTPGSDTNQAV